MNKIFIAIAAMSFSQTVWAQAIDVPDLPELPEGLGDLSSVTESLDEQASLPFDLTMSWDMRAGVRLQNDAHEKDMSLGETRLQVGIVKDFDTVSFNFAADFVLDPVADIYAVDLETGQGFIDVREANIVFSPIDFMDVKLGRQVLTWGTGDLLFINDLFAKDYKSFFIGRDNEYLKAPSDALKTSFFFGDTNIDVIYLPRFDADRFIDGTRLSFFDRASGDLTGRENPVVANRREDWFDNDEQAIRIYRSFGAIEGALYYYNGYWKSPAGQNAVTGNAEFPRLHVYGASMRGPVAHGIGSLELGYYKSAEGADSNPFVRNNEFRFMMGYEQEIGTELTGSVQYYLERKSDYDVYRASLPHGAIVDDKARHLLTVRLTKMLKQQDLKLSLFNFYSPSDKDGYMRFNVSYKLRDNLKIEAGGNVFYGQERYSFFGQFKDNTNLYTALHYDF
ncbi:MAG: hypothetical protein COA43_04740 [Robiginitomaculum sp.]|nr:MAG: hypothetical protein COA43_04740 [Robiginitomaculum sp.]